MPFFGNRNKKIWLYCAIIIHHKRVGFKCIQESSLKHSYQNDLCGSYKKLLWKTSPSNVGNTGKHDLIIFFCNKKSLQPETVSINFIENNVGPITHPSGNPI